MVHFECVVEPAEESYGYVLCKEMTCDSYFMFDCLTEQGLNHVMSVLDKASKHDETWEYEQVSELVFRCYEDKVDWSSYMPMDNPLVERVLCEACDWFGIRLYMTVYK